ncbi:MAG: outer membrane beta-barrel protein [Bacteroidales bacterium]|nr:outer membrane beta-barrel protein [Bacteroidales bacterium]
MKKFFLTMIAALMAVGVSAQVYVGGSIGFGTVRNYDFGNDHTDGVFKFLPEVGYSFNEHWAVGGVIGYQKGDWDFVDGITLQDVSTEAFVIQPYVRYTFFRSRYINALVDGVVGFTDYFDVARHYRVGLAPAVAVNLTEKLSFVSHFGFLGYNSIYGRDHSGIDEIHAFGLDLDGNDITFGLYYSF